jgi:hypothetical protein
LLQTDSAVSNAAPVSGRTIFGAGGAADSAGTNDLRNRNGKPEEEVTARR